MKPMRAKSAGVPRKIVGFHLDERFDWVRYRQQPLSIANV
jgi:hypothetical protein